MSDLQVLIPTEDRQAGTDCAPALFRRGRFQAIAERRRLARYDRVGEQLAELNQLRRMLTAASAVTSTGWVQNGWFSVGDGTGAVRIVDARNAQDLAAKPVTGACLVGAIVQAGGGLHAVHTQPVQRALDLTWHTLFRAERQPVEFCPAPTLRAAHVRDLTWWNDRPHRTADDVTALLGAAAGTAGAEIARMAPTRTTA